MSSKKIAVFTDLESAKGQAPTHGKFRLYTATMGGSTFYTWERNPMIALGRICDHMGHKAEPAEGTVGVGKTSTVKKAAKAFTKLTAEERAELLAELQGIPPAEKVETPVVDAPPSDDVVDSAEPKSKKKKK
jgi:hypothetical protein